jgi:hypothetical protein
MLKLTESRLRKIVQEEIQSVVARTSKPAARRSKLSEGPAARRRAGAALYNVIAAVYGLGPEDISPGQDITNHPHIRGYTENPEDDPLKAVVTSDTYHDDLLINFTFRSKENARSFFQEANDDFEGDFEYHYEDRNGAV